MSEMFFFCTGQAMILNLKNKITFSILNLIFFRRTESRYYIFWFMLWKKHNTWNFGSHNYRAVPLRKPFQCCLHRCYFMCLKTTRVDMIKNSFWHVWIQNTSRAFLHSLCNISVSTMQMESTGQFYLRKKFQMVRLIITLIHEMITVGFVQHNGQERSK